MSFIKFLFHAWVDFHWNNYRVPYLFVWIVQYIQFKTLVPKLLFTPVVGGGGPLDPSFKNTFLLECS